MGNAVFRNAAGRPLQCRVTSALCPARRDGSERLAISILPAPLPTRPVIRA
ncbi:MAG: hypothetical protein LC725_06660 [Lentisphaerae bacterium]|nr:hypothetical protein [Lentisphaerota bacterium]